MSSKEKSEKKGTMTKREEIRNRLNNNQIISDKSKSKQVITNKNIEKTNGFDYQNLILKGGVFFIAVAVCYIGYSLFDFNGKKNVSSNFQKERAEITNKNIPEENEVSAEEVFEKKNKEVTYVPLNSTVSSIKQNLNLNNDDQKKLRAIISHYSPSLDIRDKSLNASYRTEDLYYSIGSDHLKILTGKNKDNIVKGFETGKPLTINSNGVIDNIYNYSVPWRNGLTKFDKIIGINGKQLNPNSSLENINRALYDPKTQSINWYSSKNKKQITTAALKEEALFGKLAAMRTIGNDGLLLRINDFTNYTPRLIVQLLNNDINGKKGIVIDLRNLKDQSYNGIPEIAWLLNGQKIVKIGEITDHNGNKLAINSRPIEGTISQDLLNKINRLEKITLVNSGTSGSPELLAKSISGVVNGEQTQGNEVMSSYYPINNDAIVMFNNKIVRGANGETIKINPKFNKYININ